MPLEQGFVLNSRYRIVKLLGQGGFGAVYRAWDINLKRPCAVKENLDTTQEAKEQFEREAIILARLRHPNLAMVTDHFFLPNQGQYLVMDYVEGEDLQQIVDRNRGPVQESDALKWISQICDALNYMHTQSHPIIHRDIKPANIKITPEGKAVLVDFGIAKIYDEKLRTTVGARAITPGYSPPEQYGQGKTGPRSDIYALGATLYTILTAKVPPDSVDIVTGNQFPAESVNAINPRVTKRTSQIVMQAMDTNRDYRFKSVVAFKQALQTSQVSQAEPVAAIAGGQFVSPARAMPVGATPIRPAVYSTMKPQPKKRTSIALIIGGIVLIISVLAMGLYFVFDAIGPGRKTPEPRIIGPSEIKEETEEVIITEEPLPEMSGEITIWHYFSGDDEEAFNSLINQAQENYPDLTIYVENVGWEGINEQFPLSASAGEGPDIIMAYSSRLADWSQDGLINSLWSYINTDLDAYHWAALESMMVDGELYGLPLFSSIVGLYYHQSIISYPPEDVYQIFDLMLQEGNLSSVSWSYWLYGFFGSFGAELFDDENRCVINETGGVEAMWYLYSLVEAGALVTQDYTMAEDSFLNGDSGMHIQGSWMLQSYRDEFGDLLGFTPFPGGPGGTGRPLMESTGFSVNSSSENTVVAVELVKFLTSQEAGQTFTDLSWALPVRYDVEVFDPIMEDFFYAMDNSDLSINRKEFENFWGPFDQAFESVLNGSAQPEDALAEACAEMNELNGK